MRFNVVKTTNNKMMHRHMKSLAIRSLTFAERSFPALADGAKYSLSPRGKSRLQISTLRSRVEPHIPTALVER
ncbi:UNVERIFIED_CONTAM: hypothetical protein NCL1_11896 [Trichonephila clavipes]